MSLPPTNLLPGLLHEDANIPGFARAQTPGYQRLVLALGVLGFLGMALLVLPFLQVHYVLLRLLGRESGPALTLALILAWGTAWIFLFLWQDRIAVLGNERLKKTLLAKAQAILPSVAKTVGATREIPHYFVDIRLDRVGLSGQKNRAKKKKTRYSDIGLVYLFPDRLVFIGDVWQLTVPRTLLTNTESNTEPRWEPVLPGLTAAWFALPFADASGTLHFLARDEITAISQSYERGQVLRKNLTEWLR
jgi:hypothetical protein